MSVLTTLFLSAMPLVFLDSTAIEDAQAVRVEALKPFQSQIVLKADADKPSLWMMPTATESLDGSVRIWYQRVDKAAAEYSDQRTLCAAILGPNGLTRPIVDDTTPSWGGPNNVVLRRSPHTPTWGGFNVFQLVKRSDGYTLLYWDQPAEGDAGAMLAHSNDGLRWEKDPRGAVFTEHNDAYSLLEKDGAYILYQTMLAPWPDKPYADNLDKFRRVQSIRHSKDLIEWTPQEVVLVPDAHDDPTTEFYLMKAFPYGQGYAALLMKYYADPARPKEHSGIIVNELMVSDDARTWRRPYRETDLGFWSYAEPFTYNQKLTFAAHHERHFTIFQYRPDGLTRVVADAEGTLVTPVFTMPDTGIVLNADARDGAIELRLLDAGKSPIAGHAPLRIEAADGTDLPLPWEIQQLAGKPCRLHITLNDASLYSIREATP